MNDVSDDDLWYPTVDDILTVHQDIIAEDDDAEQGVESEDRIQFAVDYIQHGHFGERPETIHEKAFHLMRLIASNHWFVDGNKRTALNTTELFYLINGYELDYGEDIRSMLKLFSVRQDLIDREVGPDYLSDQANDAEIESGEIDDLAVLAITVVAVAVDSLDIDPENYVQKDYEPRSTQENWGLTTFGEDGTINNDDAQE